MAIVEGIGDDPVAQSSLRNRHGNIPLSHPSSVRNGAPLNPLINISPKDVPRVQRQLYDSDQDCNYDDEGLDEYEELEEDEEFEQDDNDDGHEHAHAHDTQMSKEDEEISAWWDEVFDSLIITVPFVFLYLMLDILVHLQYQHRPGASKLAGHFFRAAPTLGVLVFYTNRHIKSSITVSFLLAASIISGCRLIWVVNKAGWYLTTTQAPPTGTLWILTIVQLPLSRAVIALAIVAAYTYFSGLHIMP